MRASASRVSSNSYHTQMTVLPEYINLFEIGAKQERIEYSCNYHFRMSCEKKNSYHIFTKMLSILK